VFRDFGTWADQVLVLEALTEREDGGSGRDRLYNGIALGELCLALGDPAKALEAFRMVEERTKGTYWEARVRVGTLRSAFATGELDPSEALKSLEETASRVKKESPDTARKALNAAGDVRLAGGEWGLALGFYRRGHALRTGKEAGSNAFVRKGAFSSKVLALIEEKKYEKARQKIWEWEEEYPEEKVEGYSADLRARSHLLEGDYEKTVGAADAFLRLDRTTHFTAPVLYLKGTALWGLKRNAEAEAALRRIVKSFPETPERKKAERLLRRLKGKKSGDEEK
jgi:tetratricopeptide (TPR) repeat protein